MSESSNVAGVVAAFVGLLSVAVACSACTETPKNAPCYDPLAAECNSGGSGGAGGSDVTSQPSTFFEGTYKTGPIDYAWQFNQDITKAAEMAVAFDWIGLEAATAANTVIGQKLVAMEIEFSAGVEAKKRSPKTMIAQGLAIGKSANGDATKNELAKQYTEKSLIVLTELFAMHEVREALEATTPDDAAIEIDAAAIVFATLEGRMIKRQASEIPDLWKMGSTLITTDKLAMHTGELLFAARTKIAANAPDAVAALAKANMYATKYFYASVLNYGYKVEVAVAGAMNGEVSQAEGGTFSEGLSTAFWGADDASAKAMRDVWTGPASGVTIATLRPITIGVYGKVAADAASYYSLPESPAQKEMIELAGKIAGAIEVLTEALDASGADVPALQGKAASLVDAAVANDIAGADALAKELSAAIAAAAK